MKSIFNQVRFSKPKSNTFDLSHDRKQSMKMGELCPILVLECLPSDKFFISTGQLIRFAPMVAPVMHQVTSYVHFFFVPNRLIWPNWEDFIRGGDDGEDTTVAPYFNQSMDAMQEGDLSDYMGLPTDGPARTQAFNALPFAAYRKIWHHYYRDQNLQVDPTTDIDYECVDGVQSNAEFLAMIGRAPFKRAWQHDYFTAALPFTQKGAEVTIPLGTRAEIEFETDAGGGDFTIARIPTSGAPWASTEAMQADTASSPAGAVEGVTSGGAMALDVSANHFADLSTATAAGIIDLRNAFRLQEWYEKNARAGNRYIELIQAHFGVRSSDARLQRPEFLGGMKNSVKFSEVLQTSSTDGTTPQGNMAGHGISVGGGQTIRKYCEEHGWIIGIMSVMPKTAYQQGIERMWTKTSRFDYYWPSFAHIGEQPIQNLEVYPTTSSSNDNKVWGYVPRYAEYKYKFCTVHGTFRSSLDSWHMVRKFSGATTPPLNEDFILCDTQDIVDRVFAVTQQEHLYAHIYHNIKAVRPMPFFANPGI